MEKVEELRVGRAGQGCLWGLQLLTTYSLWSPKPFPPPTSLPGLLLLSSSSSFLLLSLPFCPIPGRASEKTGNLSYLISSLRPLRGGQSQRCPMACTVRLSSLNPPHTLTGSCTFSHTGTPYILCVHTFSYKHSPPIPPEFLCQNTHFYSLLSPSST